MKSDRGESDLGTWLVISDKIWQYLEDIIGKFGPRGIVLLIHYGITEATGHQGEMFGQERIAHLPNKIADLSVGKLLKGIIREVEMLQFEKMDHMTLIVKKILPD